ncbi:50S ribosomal protein L4 [bioreactor metagenome]|uniref:50S ribosomal protein L4 n=1 Tax=bioreactor metagenome TaxID=1076179 RepID=A0A644X4H6_9ZZZZ
MEVKVYNTNGKESSKTAVLKDEIFAIQPNDHAIYLDVKRIQADKRQGTADSTERSALSGSTRKLFRQKGTGGARRGDIKSPLLHGGARVFGPHPRDYSFKVNKKVQQLARKSALTYKAIDGAIRVVENFDFGAPKTSQMLEILKNFESSEKKSLIVLDESNKNVYLSSRNLKKVKVINASKLNTYDILNAQIVLISEASLPQLDTIFLGEGE